MRITPQEVSALLVASIIHLIVILFIYDSELLKPVPQEVWIDIDDFVLETNPYEPSRPQYSNKTKKPQARLLKPRQERSEQPELTPKSKLNSKTDSNQVSKIVSKTQPPLDLKAPPIAQVLPKKSSLENFFDSYVPPKKESIETITHPLQLYNSEELELMSPTQQQFLKSNLNIIQLITQQTINQHSNYNNIVYKSVVVEDQFGNRRVIMQRRFVEKIEGVLIVEFNLYPDGSISELKLIKSSGFELLDEDFKTMIEIAYKEYPHPSEVVLIRNIMEYKER
jgi:protein TonB